VSGGPKNYAYKVIDSVTGERKHVCKIRGITLNFNASRIVNFDVKKGHNFGEGKANRDSAQGPQDQA